MPCTLKFARLSINIAKQLIATAISCMELLPEYLAIKIVKDILTRSANILANGANILEGITTLLELMGINTTVREPQAPLTDFVPWALSPTIQMIDMGEFDVEELIDHARAILEEGS
ncbi:hypothetical protein K439DRAFT_1625440 [Ramaria rubella]|nr:hypothetical protein K439DRAFT_1625440 [Ramaria rubella]